MDFGQLFAKGQEALSLLDNAKRAVEAFKSGFSGSKDALAATEVSQLEAQLADISAKNAALSSELDDTMAKLQARG